MVYELLSVDLPVELQVVLLKKKKKKRTKTWFCRFPYLSLTGRSSDAGVRFRWKTSPETQ